jgi:hypothetical protein
MRLFTKNLAMVAVAAGMALAGAGCDKSREELQPDVNQVLNGNRKIQSANLNEMASKLAPDLLACADVARNPFRVTIVMKGMDNRTEDMPGRDLTIYVAKLTSLLNTGATADRLMFVENLAKLTAMRQQEGMSADPFGDAGRVPSTDQRLVPQYYLTGELMSMREGRTTYYLMMFHLTNFQTGAQVWNGNYELRTLN